MVKVVIFIRRKKENEIMGRAHEVRAKSMAATAAAKSKLYAKFAKEVYIAAKQGVPDMNSNLTLRKAVEKAKSLQQ